MSMHRAWPVHGSASATWCATAISISAAWSSISIAENGDSSYIAYVSQQNLLRDGEAGPVEHPSVAELFDDFDAGRYRLRRSMTH
jgi:heat shock protein HspQ